MALVRMGSETPWGTVEVLSDFAEGIVGFDTEGHGGFALTAEANTRIPASVQAETWRGLGAEGWYERDCDTCFVVAAYPELFSVQQVSEAVKELGRYGGPATAAWLEGMGARQPPIF